MERGFPFILGSQEVSYVLLVQAEGYLQAGISSISEIIHTEIGINSRFYADLVVQIEGVAHLGRQLDIVLGKSNMLILQAATQVQTVCLE